MCAYHDEEWGRPLHNDVELFEAFTLGGAQAGLSWRTILHKRENYRRAFKGFDPSKVARFGAKDELRLMGDAGIVRNKLKIASTIQNARAFRKIQKEFGSFDAYIWRFVDGKPVINRFASVKELPARTPLSDAVSKDLLGRGFKFVGSTICYATMQGIGIVNDHTSECALHGKMLRRRTR